MASSVAAQAVGLAVPHVMRCLAVCQDELVIRMLDEILLPGFEVEFIVENRPLARRLHDAGVHVVTRRPAAHRYLPQGRHLAPAPASSSRTTAGAARARSSRRCATPAARSSTCWASAPPPRQARRGVPRRVPDVTYLAMSELFGGPLLTEFSRSLTRARVQQYQRYFSDADRVLIMLHNDPDPDAMASGLALRNVLRRTKTTAIIGAMQGVTRPENLRMVEPARHPRRDRSRRRAFARLRPHRHGRRAAALLRRPDRSRRPGHRPPSRAARLHARSSRTSAPTTARPARSSPSTCARST